MCMVNALIEICEENRSAKYHCQVINLKLVEIYYKCHASHNGMADINMLKIASNVSNHLTMGGNVMNFSIDH